MRRLFVPWIVIGFAGVVAAGCTMSRAATEFRTPPSGATCDTASAQVVTFGQGSARLSSELALKHQVSDLRGYMFSSGLRRIQLVQQTNECAPVIAGGVLSSLHQCTVRAQLCGR